MSTTATTGTTGTLASQLRLSVMRLARRLRQQTAGDITLSQLSALASVERNGPLALKELAEIERVTPPSMTRIAGHLEERGLVVRTVDAVDHRIARVAITASGTDLLALTRTRRDAYLAARIQALSADDNDVLARAVPILERLLEEHDE